PAPRGAGPSGGFDSMSGKLPRARRALGLALALLAMLVLPMTASAHKSVDVGGGKYTMEVGFLNEPAYQGLPNGLYLNVRKYASGGTQPVENLAGTLKAEVSKDGKTMPLDLVPQEDQPGVYTASFFPTATGDYTFHVFGTIDGAPVDQSMTSSPTTFDPVIPAASAEFPVQTSDVATVAQTATNAESAASAARAIGIAGVVLGVIGTALGAVGLARGRRVVERTAA
ncbi:MAG TPA: hypothetical protein VFU81_03675, partial [Thermomicrobiales bacterium]|nr:hypothetical protein [Thermomicrobiales bacterium]